MCKIYPPPFNKFAIFILYGLLSIAATTLAQCGLSSKYGLKTIGYIDLFKNPPKNLDTFKWELYDQINIIVYEGPGPYNSIHNIPKDLGPGSDSVPLVQINSLVDKIKVKNPDTEIFLSIRNYDPAVWPGPGPDDDEYKNIATETISTLENLNGVDIEYPGMRGIYCGGTWKNEKGKKDGRFIKFLRELKGQMNGKPLMLTVGKDIIPGLKDEDIDFLNIETHHNSIYNLGDPPKNPIKSYPNSPLTVFDKAYNDWAGKIGGNKIFMSVDFGNTYQVVSNQEIENSPSVDTDIMYINEQDPFNNNLKKIQFCPALDDNLNLYSFPWRDLSTSILDPNRCSAKADWNYKLDPGSSTPWLYKAGVAGNEDNYHFVSFEDFTSLSKKLDFAMDNKVAGISISDISYDDDEGSLLSFVHVNRETKPTEGSPNPSPSTTGTTHSNSPSSTTNSTDTNTQTDGPGSKAGTIAGAVIGSLFGSIIILGAGFLWYRNRDRPKSSSFKSLLNFKAIPSSIRNHTNSRDTEMTSDPSPNHRFAVPSTTAVIPIASGYVTALFDFTGKEENDLSFKKGDKIEVLERGDGPNDWWVGRVNGAVGEFPGNYVKET